MRDEKPMSRRQLHLPDDLWKALQQYAAELSMRAGKPVSVAEAARRILERSLKRRG